MSWQMVPFLTLSPDMLEPELYFSQIHTETNVCLSELEIRSSVHQGESCVIACVLFGGNTETNVY